MKPTKMRNRLIYNATHVVQSKQIGSALSGDLRKRYGRRSVRVTKGDHVSVQRGEFKGVDGKVTTVSPDKRCVTIEGIKKEKTKGDKFDYLIHTTNLLVTSLNTGDKWRMKILRRGKATGKADETAEVEPVPDKKAKPVQADAPAKDKVAPAKDKVAPAKDKVAPAKDKVAPAKDKVAPAKDKVAPAKDKVAPAKDKVAPQGQGSASQGQGSASQGQGSASQGQGSASQGQGSASQGQGSASQGQGSASQGQGSASQGQGSASQGQGSASQGQGSASQGQGQIQGGKGIMVSISGSKKLKRQMAPQFWGIERKNKRFVITVRPGSHGKNRSVPTAVFLRDVLKMVVNLREAKAAIYAGSVKIDGVVRKSLHHSIGLMDVVELKNVPDTYRMVPTDGKILKPIKINDSEKAKKLVQVTSKTTISGGKMQIGFHDGRSVISDIKVNVGDTCLMEIPGQKILEVIPLEAGCQVLVTRGINAGQTGTVETVEAGTFILPKRVTLALEDRRIEIPAEIIMPVGTGEPVIQIR